MQALADLRARVLGFTSVEDLIAAEGPVHGRAVRHRLLEDKRVLATSMENLRATMRTLQEDGECCTTRARSSAGRLLATECERLAVEDELEKVRGQLRRSRVQISEHVQAGECLARRLEACAGAFSEAISQEVESQEAVRHEVDQLRGVTEDLEGRLEAKVSELQRLREANEAAVAKVTAAANDWRQARESCEAALDASDLGTCVRAIQELIIAEQRRQQQAARRPEDKEPELRPTACAELPPRGCSQSGLEPQLPVQPDLQVLRDLVSSKEEQLAALHRKIRFLSEPSGADECYPSV